MKYLILILSVVATSVAATPTDKECQFSADILNLLAMGYSVDKSTVVKAIALGKKCGIYLEDVKSSK